MAKSQLQNFELRISPKDGRLLKVGVMGGEASDDALKDAEQLGRLLAQNGIVTVNGGTDRGIMRHVSKGANAA
ncbi:MAG: hypothetical protein JRH20_23125, partial [Deltaproteobacteria bacterium]|nr:hypothetical protein [Deltaproteobacteria bacterium]